MRSIRLNVPHRPGPAPMGLLVPVPPETAYQRLESRRCSAAGTDYLASNSHQGALFIPDAGEMDTEFEFELSDGNGASPAEHFTLTHGDRLHPSAELKQAIQELIVGVTCREAVTRIVEMAASLFDYGHPKRRFNDGRREIPLLLTRTQGSCLDINSFLLSAFAGAGVPAAYYAGYFFAPETPTTAKRYHCWVSTCVDGDHRDWDIAQHIKTGTRQVLPALNPNGGQRIALSCGRSLRFSLPQGEITVAHLGHPLWVHADGSTESADAVATLREEYREQERSFVPTEDRHDAIGHHS
jgi:hypothetical protein